MFSKGQGIFHVAKSPRNCFSWSILSRGSEDTPQRARTTTALKHSVDMSLPGIGEDFSLLDTIIAELPELFYAEILPKLDRQTALNLAQVNKTWRDTVWSVDGFRSMEAHWGPRPARPYWIPPSHWIPPMPIFWAVHHGNVPAVRALLKSGVDVNKRYSGIPQLYFPLLHYAVYKRHVSIVALLLDAGANAREPEFWGKSPIDAARQYGHENIVELLKAAGA